MYLSKSEYSIDQDSLYSPLRLHLQLQSPNSKELTLFKRKDCVLENILLKSQHTEQLNLLRNEIATLKEHVQTLQEEKENIEFRYQQKMKNQNNLLMLLKEELHTKTALISSFDSYIKSFITAWNYVYQQIVRKDINDIEKFQLNAIKVLDNAIEQFQKMPSLGKEIDLFKIQVKNETNKKCMKKINKIPTMSLNQISRNGNKSSQSLINDIENYKPISNSRGILRGHSIRSIGLNKKRINLICLIKTMNLLDKELISLFCYKK